MRNHDPKKKYTFLFSYSVKEVGFFSSMMCLWHKNPIIRRASESYLVCDQEAEVVAAGTDLSHLLNVSHPSSSTFLA